VPTSEKDINLLYEEALETLRNRPVKVESKPDGATVQEDYYRSFRTKCVFLFFFNSFLKNGVDVDGFFFY
jgi:chitin synthase